ncbi:MAG: translocation/assembly module TamB domain-containing protein, partial [Candidatus Krumholzibacteria bacterium]|nr:translocation/assembly module TamB domain-containing protein [Candidatus Krumholzibacteria bacterium]
DTLVTVSKLAGREGKDGRFECAGSIVLEGWRPSRYDLDVRLEKFLVASINDILAIVTGRVTIGTEIVGGSAVPSIEGAVEVNRAEVFYAFEEQGAPGAAGTFATPSWLARVDVEIPGNAWIRTPDANIELRGDITLYHDQRGTYFRGHLDLVRGWYNIYANKFRVRSGTVDFVRAEDNRPVVNIEAETPDPEGRTIFLTLLWLQDDVEPRVTLTHEDPGYSETDIWKMLGGGVVRGPGDADASFDAVTTAQGLAANYIERVLNSQMEGITIEVEKGTSSAGANGATDYSETMVAVGKYLSEGLYVKYKQGLSISTARHIEVEYRINRWVLLRSELIKYSERVIQGKSTRTSDEFNVDLKLRWEF